MALKAVRSNVKVGGTSIAMIVPSQLEIGRKSNIAANRLLIADVRGEISEDDLLVFLEEVIEPQFWAWYRQRKADPCAEKHGAAKTISEVEEGGGR